MAALINKKSDLKQKCYNSEVQPYTVEGASNVLRPLIMLKFFEKNFRFHVK